MPILSAVLLLYRMQQRRRAGYTVPDGPGIEDGKPELSFGLAIPKCPSALSLPAADSLKSSGECGEQRAGVAVRCERQSGAQRVLRYVYRRFYDRKGEPLRSQVCRFDAFTSWLTGFEFAQVVAAPDVERISESRTPRFHR